MRTFSAYEQTQLAKFNVPISHALTLGEMPVEYMTGHVQFGTLDLIVNQSVLIPRVETEELVDIALALCQEKTAEEPTAVLKVADVGTGSGAIATALAVKAQQAGIQLDLALSDQSEAALAVARQNWERHLSQPVRYIHSDLLSAYPAGSHFDLMIANLPYIPSERIPMLERSVIEFEPHVALDGGKDGLRLIARLLDQASTYLAPSGILLLEIDITQAETVLCLHPDFSGRVISDSFGQARFAVLKAKN